MDNTFKLFIEYLRVDKKYSQNTLFAYQSDLEQFGSYVKNTFSTDSITTSQIVDNKVLSGYLQTLRNKDYSLSTVARKIASIKSLIKYLFDTGKLKNDVIPNISSPQVNKPVPKMLTIAEVRLFLAEPAKTASVEAKRDKAMLELLYATGLRATELMGLDVNDVDFEACKVTCRKARSKTRNIPIDTYIENILREYIKESRIKLINSQNEVALFVNMRGERLTRQGFWQIIQGYADKAGLGKKVTPRILRHSFAIHKLKGGADLQTMQELLGHAHISTTKVYQAVKGD